MINPIASVGNALNKLKPFDLKINGKSFKLDYECFLYQDRAKELILKVALFNTYLQEIKSCSLEVAGVEVFRSRDQEEDDDGIVELSLKIGSVTRELNFKAIGEYPEIQLIDNNKGITNSNINKLNEQFKGLPSEFNELGKLEKIGEILKADKDNLLTYYVQSKKIIFIHKDYESKDVTEIKRNTSKFRIFEAEQNLNNDLLTLKGIPYFLLEVGTQIKYKSKALHNLNNKYQNIFTKKDTETTYIVDSIEMRVSTRTGVQAEYKCKTLDVIKREVNNAKRQSQSEGEQST